ncbi:MAG: sda-2 [Jatrophihabitans sp.]|nr:sda-2 [Jatrophihabitans sp.]MCW2658487.1 sda-2 [Jatrophihabitans sp.]MDT4905970.1 L-serine dehydratase [Pseudonocardiales bacterium]MDT4931287.1 L-serine dehydratase [Pseudonocardiales bacterium]MDT4950821.1 L-serine dehydratase [Pseudonocardiales bacterium]
MAISVFDLFSIGMGPSSSHTVGPMRAARTFAQGLADDGVLDAVTRVRVELFGSLGATGHGHGSDRAVMLGLEGEHPETVDTTTVPARAAAVRESGRIELLGKHSVALVDDDLVLHRRQSLPFHPNGMRFFAFDDSDELLRERTYYSVGGGFVVDEEAAGADRIKADDTALAYPFLSGAELLQRCAETGLPVSGVMLANEQAWRTEAEIRAGLLEIWAVMMQCVQNGWTNPGTLPGGLKVRRRAPELYQRLCDEPFAMDPLRVLDWVDLFALAVNEENAAGGRVVTAPTNGAAGVLPAVLHYYMRFVPGATEDGVVRFLLCAAAIGVLYKENASISGAEVGCQGEVGSACSMAAGALCEVLGGTPEQVENAAEIGMEHNLGLTCDPVGGLVQVPCIERNAMAAVKAINAARIALRGDGQHIVSLDKVIKTMRETGADMKVKYKETARGGLAVNVIEC